TASRHLGLPQGETEHIRAYQVHGTALLRRLREQQHGVGDAPPQSIRCPQECSHIREKAWKSQLLTEAYGPFEQRKRPRQVALADEQPTNPPIGPHEARGVSN